MASYPEDAALTLRLVKDPFANPVGNTIQQETDFLFDALLRGASQEEIGPHLDSIIRIRTIQDFSPAQSLAFIFLLKDVVRKELGDADRSGEVVADLLRFESRVDSLALLAFDMYAKCCEQVHTLRADEVKRQAAKLLERAERKEKRLESGAEAGQQPIT